MELELKRRAWRWVGHTLRKPERTSLREPLSGIHKEGESMNDLFKHGDVHLWQSAAGCVFVGGSKESCTEWEQMESVRFGIMLLWDL